MVVVVTFLLVVDVADKPSATPATDLGAEIQRFAAGLHDDAPYRAPKRSERRQLLSALHALETGKPVEALGFTVHTGTDKEIGRAHV